MIKEKINGLDGLEFIVKNVKKIVFDRICDMYNENYIDYSRINIVYHGTPRYGDITITLDYCDRIVLDRMLNLIDKCI